MVGVTRIVFIGDSVTDCGRSGTHTPLGDGYVRMIRDAEHARHPEVRWINRGVGGDTVRDLAVRWEPDAIATAPDVLCVLIGINDVWRAFQGVPEQAVPLDEYGATLHDLLVRAVGATGCHVVVAEPYLVEPDRSDPQRLATERYATRATTLAAEAGATSVALQRVFDDAMRRVPPSDLAADRVHPTPHGHQLIATAFRGALASYWC